MDRQSRYFTLSLDSLRAIGGWAADCAERALSLYEVHADSDARPRAAIAGIREFVGGASARPGCVPLPWRRMPLHVRSAILRPPPLLVRRALRRPAPTRIPWRMSIKPSTSSVQRPMPHWPLSSTTMAIQGSPTARSVGQSSTPPLKRARSCSGCPLVKPARVDWTRSSMSWMRASALGTCRKTPAKKHIEQRGGEEIG